MHKPIIIGIAVLIAYLLVSFLPFLHYGKDWALIWFLINSPIASMTENIWGIGNDSWGIIIGISIFNGAVLGLIVGLISVFFIHKRARS